MEEQERYAAFISYAVEDKEEVVEPIVKYLAHRGINVYFAGDDLRPGDTIADVINEAMHCSTYAIFVLSPHCNRHWPAIEHFHFRQKEKEEERALIFPVWHNISYAEVKEKFPWISERYGVSTDKGIDRAAAELYKAIRRRLRENKRRKKFTWLKRLAAVVFIVAAAVSVAWPLLSLPATIDLPSRQSIEAVIEERIGRYESTIANTIQKKIAQSGGEAMVPDSIDAMYARFVKLGRHERNEYKFVNGYVTLSGRKNIQEAGVPAEVSPHTRYGIASPAPYLLEYLDTDTGFTCAFLLVSRQPVQYNLDTFFFSGDKICAHVRYVHSIRAAECRLLVTGDGNTRRQQVLLMGFKPFEEYVLEMRDGVWKLSTTR